ncbi:NAD(P)/FAD-dependent oxidoreductase [Spirosoma sp. BT702]|uniref:NADH:ubiquinone reductase (non-electrogenic) n=1 Tax=Spirosoma profusum TaxID=2771354 RepID=A0A927ASC3_9BACT|nr:NAD(P)/FAD-dependent oxidoreductase [Spirosoma profusum]MBD2703616.1 NAD(P)/FAD-dependent oxidoreductase [Spirosoma profusum]
MLQFDKLSLNIPDTAKPRVVIIGGGFGGMNLAKSLRNTDVQIVLFDKQNYNGFWPLLYQVATAGLEPDAIAEPFRKMFDGYEDFHYRMVRVNKIDTSAKTVTTLIGELHYDYLVIAAGSKSNFFGNADIQKYAFPLKTIPEALNVRSQFLQCFEQASVTTDPAERESLLTFVIAGAGPTGVEMAGSLAEMRKHVLPNDYPGLDFSQMKIYVVEGLGKVLPPMSDEAGKKSQKYLEDLGVIIKLNTLVEAYDGETVTFKGGEKIRTQTLVWGAGVTGALIAGIPTEAIEKGRILVDPINRVQGLNDVFAIGDIAFMKLEDYPKGHPGVAQPAIQQGKHLAKNLRHILKNESTEPFEYFDKGSLAIVGRSRAVADLPGNVHLGGFIAWMAWLFVHIWYLVGFRSKLIVFSNWMYRLFTYQRGTRIIIRPFVRKDDVVGQKILVQNEME